MIVIGRKVLLTLYTELTFGFIQLFDLQRPIAENFVGADIDGSTARINNQRMITGLWTC